MTSFGIFPATNGPYLTDCFDDTIAASRENRSAGFPTRSDTNRTVQSQKMARGLQFWI